MISNYASAIDALRQRAGQLKAVRVAVLIFVLAGTIAMFSLFVQIALGRSKGSLRMPLAMLSMIAASMVAFFSLLQAYVKRSGKRAYLKLREELQKGTLDNRRHQLVKDLIFEYQLNSTPPFVKGDLGREIFIGSLLVWLAINLLIIILL